MRNCEFGFSGSFNSAAIYSCTKSAKRHSSIFNWPASNFHLFFGGVNLKFRKGSAECQKEHGRPMTKSVSEPVGNICLMVKISNVGKNCLFPTLNIEEFYGLGGHR